MVSDVIENYLKFEVFEFDSIMFSKEVMLLTYLAVETFQEFHLSLNYFRSEEKENFMVAQNFYSTQWRMIYTR